MGAFLLPAVMEETLFRTNAFGQRITCNPRLRFLEGGEGGEGGGESQVSSEGVKTPQEEGFDFPADTAVADMSDAQKVEYWRHKARIHERANSLSPAYVAQLKQAAAELAQLKAANATAEEKALEDARLQGENIGAQRYVKAAVKGEIRASAPHLKPEQVDELLSIIDTSAVIRDDGEVDAEKVGKIISSFAPAAKQETQVDSYSDTIRQSRQASGAGSIAELKKQYHEQHSKKG